MERREGILGETGSTIWLDKLTSTEVAELDRERTILVLPTGCTEQQGPHLPLDTDTYLVTLFLSEATTRARADLRRQGIKANIWAIGPGGDYFRIAQRVFNWEPVDVHAGEFPTSISLLTRPDELRQASLGPARPFDAGPPFGLVHGRG